MYYFHEKNVFLIKRSEPPLGVDISKGIIYLGPEEVLSALSELVYMNPNLYSSKTNFLRFYWNYPFHATKISMRIGIISIILGVLSLITSIIL
jgi:hypothetical protein